MIMTGDGNNNDDGNDDDVKMIIIKTRGVNIKSENIYFDDNDASNRYDNYRQIWHDYDNQDKVEKKDDNKTIMIW